ncbi:hypothetical protein Sgly_2143 [Syntrophobotulus glycolicus DSM 8271]|uniref:DUF4367 domain-containing protein n=1 Tax=Syntrophobotulus glycolicus (strain DSM 8271 / FlGlyR) TaxID=645991 RepID=F0T2N3_SYNGF|nr:DUF4367 domain-containing protein [Syntrophobotulus glycolicus]ADY56432.1 hypothetical protein Sgly_2143 [Syntrophobotulus glycolicus DSM 8271]
MSERELAKPQAEEKILEALFEYAAACHVDNIMAEYPVEASSDFVFPSEFERRMKKLIARHNRKELLKNIRKKTIKILPRAVIFLFVLIGSFTIVVASVEALRVKALNIIMNIQSQYTSIEVKNKNNGQTEQIKEQIPQNWNGYAPTYVPHGFKVDRTEKREMKESIYFTNEQGQIIEFIRYLAGDTDLRIDTEGASVQDTSIHNKDALLAEKAGFITIAWKEEYLFSLIGEADKAEMIKMAESIVKK